MTRAYDTIDIAGQPIKLAHALEQGLVRLRVEHGNLCDRDIRGRREIYVAYAVNGRGRWIINKLFYKAHAQKGDHETNPG